MGLGMGMGLWLGHNPAVAAGGGGGATYTKYRLSVTKDAPEFWTGVASLAIASSVGGADKANSVDNAGVTYFSSPAGGTAASAFDKNSATSWEIGFSSEPYPHIIGADFTAGTPFNAAQYTITTESSGQPKTWTFEGWNGSSWVVLDTQTDLVLASSSNNTYVLP